MCKLTKNVKGARRGWKVVLVEDTTGKVYSPATGVEYAAGKPVTPFSGDPALRSNHFYPWLSVEGCTSYDENMVGRTCVFALKPVADALLGRLNGWGVYKKGVCAPSARSLGYSYKLAEMTVSGGTMSGMYGDNKVFGGKFIDKMEVLD